MEPFVGYLWLDLVPTYYIPTNPKILALSTTPAERVKSHPKYLWELQEPGLLQLWGNTELTTIFSINNFFKHLNIIHIMLVWTHVTEKNTFITSHKQSITFGSLHKTYQIPQNILYYKKSHCSNYILRQVCALSCRLQILHHLP